MTYAILSASALLLILFIADVIVAIRDRRHTDRGRVYLPAYYAYVGAVCGGVFLALTVGTALSDEELWIPLCFLGFALLCGFISMTHLNLRVTYNEEGFTHKNFLGFKRTFAYTDITGIRERPSLSDTLLYLGRRRVVVETLAVGGMQFEWHLRKRYRSVSGGRSIPEVKSKRGDPFNGHVEGGATIVIAYVLVGALCLGMLAASAVYTWLLPPTPEKSVVTEVEIQIKYEGYIRRQMAEVERNRKLENMRLPADIDYEKIEGLRIEARQKLSANRPLTLGQASRISGVSPADISVLLIRLSADHNRG